MMASFHFIVVFIIVFLFDFNIEEKEVIVTALSYSFILVGTSDITWQRWFSMNDPVTV